MEVGLPNRLRFGAFEFDLKAGELRKGARKVLLQEQPFQLLLMLVERRGDIVTLDEIKKRLWPNDTVVEFDHSIHNAIKKLRRSLGDSADNPKYVETVARRGYRLIVPVEWEGDSSSDSALAAAEDSSSTPSAPADPSQPGLGNLIGQKVSHYRVLEIIGGGGMGLVYKAEDLKLGRRVALKFLPEELAGDPVALQRFEREARTASSLSHPNICTIYEVEEHEGQPFIVMELLEGETLRDRLARSGAKAVPVNQILDIALQICDGLQAAHQKGVIHRDIKPANIFLTAQGPVKILDFGLAKLAVEASDPSTALRASFKGSKEGAAEAPLDLSSRAEPPAFGGAVEGSAVVGALENADPSTPCPPGRKDAAGRAGGHSAQADGARVADPTLTRTGMAMGTAGYMSPEQVRGEKLDARTDLSSFGLVLYEMATGQRAFTGNTAPILKDAILNNTPIPVRELNSTVPPKLEEIINKAIEKDREKRYQSAAEMRGDLATLQGVPARPKWPIAAALGVCALVLLAAMWFSRSQPSASLSRELRQQQLTTNSNENGVVDSAVSPDGKYLVYADLVAVHIKELETGAIQTMSMSQLLGVKQFPLGSWWFAWFPDATRFFSSVDIPGQGRSVWLASVNGGTPHKILDDVTVWSVSPDGSSVAFTTNAGRIGDREIWVMDPGGEHARKVLQTDESGGFVRVEWSPNGQRIAYASNHQAGANSEAVIESRDLQGGPPTRVLSPRFWSDGDVQDFYWLPSGSIIYSASERDTRGLHCNFWEVPIDGNTGAARDNPRRLANWPAGLCMDSLSATADGKKLVFHRYATERPVYVADLRIQPVRLTGQRRLTLSESFDWPAAWTADSKAVIFSSNRNGGRWGIFKQSLDSNTAEPIFTGLENAIDPRVSPDGSWILYISSQHDNFSSRSSPSEPRQVMRVPTNGGSPQLVLTAVIYDTLHCARLPAAFCAIAEQSRDLKQLVFTAVDPLKGRGRELARFDTDPNGIYSWDLSPDGGQIAVVRHHEGRVHILSLTGQALQQITVRGWTDLDTLYWMADGNGMFISAVAQGGPGLLHVDLQGNAHLLWQQGGASERTYGVPSPNGRHLAMLGWNENGNIWMMENF